MTRPSPPQPDAKVWLSGTGGLSQMTPPLGPPSKPSSPDYLVQMTAVLGAIAMMLAARFLLLLGVMGAFTLTFLAVQNPQTPTLIASGSFDVLVVIPLILLYLRRG